MIGRRPKTGFGSRMVLTPRQRASWLAHLWKAITQQHHTALRPMFAGHVGRDAVVIDIGAHAGQFTKLFARMAPDGAVYAFEPSAYARSVLAPAVRFNRLRNIEIVPLGLSDHIEARVLHTPLKRHASLGFGIAHLGEGAAIERAVDQLVGLTTLDAFIIDRGIDRVDLIKADIEGWELRALKGGEETLKRFRPALYLEIDEACLVRAGDTPADVFGWLSSLGYRGFATPDLMPAPRHAGAGDYLFTAEQSA